MNYWVHAVKTPTSLWVGRLTKCANPTSQWHFGSIVLVLFFVVWIVVTVSVRGDSPRYDFVSVCFLMLLFSYGVKTIHLFLMNSRSLTTRS